MDRKQLHNIFVIGIGLIAAYVFFVTFRDIAEVYNTSAAFFEGSNAFYPWLFTIGVAIVPIFISVVAYFVYTNKRPIVILLLSLYSLLVYLSYSTLCLVFLVSLWWFIVYSSNTPNKALKRDAEKTPRHLA